MWGKEWQQNTKFPTFMFICTYIVHVSAILLVLMCTGVAKAMS